MIITDAGIKIEQEEYEKEDELQRLIFEHPELIGEEGSELVSIAREVNTSAGRIDVLAMTTNGTITLVEVKLGRNGQSRREVLAQILDYISELADYSYFKLNAATNGELERAVEGLENNAELPRIIEDNLRNGLVRLVIAVDESNDDLRRLVEFVARHTDLRVDLVEIKKYLNNGEYYYSSNVIVQSSFTTMSERVTHTKDYPLLDEAVYHFEQLDTVEEFGGSLSVRNNHGSYRQIRVKGWPAAIHYEFTILHNKPTLYVRLDNELSGNDSRSGELATVMEDFAGEEIDGYKIESRPYSRATGTGKIIYVALSQEEVDKAGEIMVELIRMTQEAVTQVVGGSISKPTTFEMLEIPVGAVLEPLNDRYPMVVTVDSKNAVRLGDGTIKTISRAAKDAAGTSLNGFSCYKYKGEILSDIRKRMDKNYLPSQQ
ncbi:DUF91 domain-containing protein [Candidatus Saccharibacteria bacterium]|nr:DUF91 domain-containing protein [Candidatus Saccharibacteria bacterium]